MAAAFDVAVTHLSPLVLLARAGVNAALGVVLFELVDRRLRLRRARPRSTAVSSTTWTGPWYWRCGVVTAIGIATILSATHNSRFSGLYLKQMYAVGLGVWGW